MQRLVLFAKRPRLGRVKTRLVPPLSPAQALELYRALLGDQLRFVAGFVGLERELCLDGPRETGAACLGLPSELSVRRQGAGDLGQRLARLFERSWREGAQATVVLGVDAPTLPAARIDEAFAALAGGAPAVVAPAADGGYVLLGLTRPIPGLLSGIPWGSAGVLEATRAQAAALGIPLLGLDEARDVDRPEDLERLLGELRSPPAARRAPDTARWLDSYRRSVL